MTDAELASLSQQGDLAAFNELARRWEHALFRFVRRVLGNDEDARDTCQDALLKAYQNIGRLRDPGSFKAWLHHIALNLCRDRHRSAKVRKELAFEEGGIAEAQLVGALDDRTAPDKLAERTNLAEILSEILGRLSLEQRTAILLREYQGFTSEEIGQITGVPAATVRSRVFYGLRSMRRMLPQYGITPESFWDGGNKP